PPSSRSLGTSRPSTGWAAITSKGATATASTPCSPPPGTTSVCSCAGSSGFCVPRCECCLQPQCQPKTPKECSSVVLHGRPIGGGGFTEGGGGGFPGRVSRSPAAVLRPCRGGAGTKCRLVSRNRRETR